MNHTIKSLFVSIAVLLFAMNCGKSGGNIAAEMQALAAKSKEIACSKTVECAQEQFGKMPEAQRKFIPPMLQSKEACMESMEKSAAEQRAKTGKRKRTSSRTRLPKNCKPLRIVLRLSKKLPVPR